MLFQDYGLFEVIQPLLAVLFFIILMALMLIVYIKIENWLISLVIFLFSLIIGALSVSIGDIPFTPYFQIFFITFQLIIFAITSLDVYRK